MIPDITERFAKILLDDIQNGAGGPQRTVEPEVFAAISQHATGDQQSRYQEVITAYEAWRAGRVSQGLFMSKVGTVTYR